ncbi:hypothetical protein H5410_020619 [Solanum commersonii]|uniref:DUF4283 domain-containing protein n=1 Tax=Solanum commersonii TaxID=4109 RepID=A0A9J5Z9L7_SOLCO|nr:hypothetical protein H5410_020619 [Solanum commersonii]
MIWITQVMREASRTKGNVVKRWRRLEPLSEIYCARNFNKYGRYLSLISIRGRRRSVIIILEFTLNSGWENIADKMGRFLSSHRKEVESTKQRLVDNNFPFAEAVRSIKWTNRKGDGVNAQATLMKEEGIICINESSNTHNEVMQRRLVGDFEGKNNVLPNLAEMRSWANKFWRQSHGLNIYEMGAGKFLFEFAMKTMTEQVIAGEWIWNNSRVRLEWWSPTLVATNMENKATSTWTKIVGLPLHLWSETVFKAIGDLCGGWIETEEETQNYGIISNGLESK